MCSSDLATTVDKARFPVIDAHAHSSMNDATTRAGMDAWVRTMDETGVEMSVVFTGASGAEFDRQAELFLGAYPKRFQVWYSPDTSNPEAPDFTAKLVAELDRVYKKGARGVGEITDKGYINQRAVLARRAEDVLSLHNSPKLDRVVFLK